MQFLLDRRKGHRSARGFLPMCFGTGSSQRRRHCAEHRNKKRDSNSKQWGAVENEEVQDHLL